MIFDVEIKVLDASAEDVVCAVEKLEIAAGWMSAGMENRAEVSRLLKNSVICVGAYVDGEMAGFARALSDGVETAYIVDFTVLPKFRRKGVGTQMCRFLVARLKDFNIPKILCISTPEAKNVYSKVGKPLENCSPIRFV